METRDIRWLQRFDNLRRTMAQLDEAMQLMDARELSRLEKQGVIQGFEYGYELGWNTLKDYLIWQGIADLVGSRDTIREAFSKGLVEDGNGWMKMLTDRNRTSHTYDEAILQSIRFQHYPLLKALEATLLRKAEDER